VKGDMLLLPISYGEQPTLLLARRRSPRWLS